MRGLRTLSADLEETLAVKTGDVRGADEGRQALSRSCAGQQNLCFNSVSASMRHTLRAPPETDQPPFVDIFAVLEQPLSDLGLSASLLSNARQVASEPFLYTQLFIEGSKILLPFGLCVDV